MMRLPVTGPRLREAVGNDLKGKASPVIYLAGILLAFVEPWLALVPFVVVALIWLVPDRRVERYLAQPPTEHRRTEPAVPPPRTRSAAAATRAGVKFPRTA